MDRTLYINEKPGLKVVSDGPSLWITEKGRAGRRVPVRLIGRAVIKGSVNIDAGAITLLTENGVPVCFVSHSGCISAVLPISMERTALHGNIERCSYSEKGSYAMEGLLRSTRRNVQRSVLKDIIPDLRECIGERGLKEKEYLRCIESLLPHAPADGVKAVSTSIDGIFFEFMLKRVLEAGLPPHAGFLNRFGNFGLVKDFLYVLEAERDRELVQFFKSSSFENNLNISKGILTVNVAGMHAIALRFENNRKCLQAITEKLLNGFFDILRELAV